MASRANGTVPSVEITISTGVFSDENPQKFALQTGGSLRIGRDPASHMTVDLNGVSGTHAELLFQRLGEGLPLELCICDHSKNGTAVRPGPHVPGSSWANKVAPAWQRCIAGVPRALGHGWQVLAPAKSRKGESQVPFHKRMLTVYSKVQNVPQTSDPVATTASALTTKAALEEKLKVLEEAARANKEKKRKHRQDDPNRKEKKRAKDGSGLAAPAPAPEAAPNKLDRRVEQQGAVEEELERREFAHAARPKRRATAPAPGGIAAPAEEQVLLRSPSPEKRDDERDEQEAASRAVAAAAAMRAMRKKVEAPPPRRLSTAGTKSKPATQAAEEIDSDEEGAGRKVAPLTSANVATLGGSKTIDFDLRSISPISAPGVALKKKKKKVGPSESPAPRKRKPDKAKLVGRSKDDSPDRWDPSPVKKKRGGGSDDERADRTRMRSREKRKHRR